MAFGERKLCAFSLHIKLVIERERDKEKKGGRDFRVQRFVSVTEKLKIADGMFLENEGGVRVQVLNRCRPSSTKENTLRKLNKKGLSEIKKQIVKCTILDFHWK